MESYYEQLCSNLDAEDNICDRGEHHNNDTSQQQPTPTEAPILLELNGNPNFSIAQNFESLKKRTSEARRRILLKKKEVNADVERHAKAERTICLCEDVLKHWRFKLKKRRIMKQS